MRIQNFSAPPKLNLICSSLFSYSSVSSNNSVLILHMYKQNLLFEKASYCSETNLKRLKKITVYSTEILFYLYFHFFLKIFVFTFFYLGTYCQKDGCRLSIFVQKASLKRSIFYVSFCLVGIDFFILRC